MLAIGNQEFQDRFLFAGGLVRTKPFQQAGDGINFQGNTLSMLTFGLDSTTVSQNVGSTHAFGGLSQGTVGLTDLDPIIHPETRLSELNDMRGVGKGAIRLSDGNDAVTIDLANAYRLSDVVEKINATSVSGRQLSATLNSNGLQIDYADNAGGVLRINNVGSGKTASELGIETTVPAPGLPIVGNDLRPSVDLQTNLSDLFGGAGLSNNGGIRIQQGSQSYDVSFAGAQTVEDLLVKINNSGAKVQASIAPDGRRLQIQSTLSGVDYSISELNSNTASVLGLKTFHSGVRLADLNHGQGIYDGPGNDLDITRTDGSQLLIDVSSAITVGDLVDIINNHADNQDPALKVTASLNSSGNGLVLSAAEPTPPNPNQPISIRNAGGSQAASGLGLVAKNQIETVSTLNSGVYTIAGADSNPQEVSGVFNSIVRLRNAILGNDAAELERIAGQLDVDLDRIGLVRGQIGVEQQRIDSLKIANEDQITQAAEDQSLLLDTDYAQAISELGSRQVAYEASLQLLANMIKGANLFNFI